ncbi:unnamed protein product [Vitrella brassicaformis CCMP3155]|uniref:Uncharacterized protein n=1 Tax=Vitrella brassicaformis (strain CCMP3155) TaxID=1169540 RepID=A0A0G4GXT0_VITBC|nr:unnamed protein product [Vitrella brassicaformis CCMP3155]|eukprot:CEM35915.1 unnamed protein product [Vitrella brassicaformis CCMP3155]
MSCCCGDTVKQASEEAKQEMAAEEDEAIHGEVPADTDCLICFETITCENYVEYQTQGGSQWHPAKFCWDCIQQLLKEQFQKYMDGVQNTDCEREQRALLSRGPPIRVRDKNGFPECGDEEVGRLWLCGEGRVHEGKVEGCVEGEERMKLWNTHRQFMVEKENDNDKETDERFEAEACGVYLSAGCVVCECGV